MPLVVLLTVVFGIRKEQRNIRDLVDMCFFLALKLILQLTAAEIEGIFRHLILVKIRHDLRILDRMGVVRQRRKQRPDRNNEDQRNDDIGQQSTIFAQVVIHSFSVVSSAARTCSSRMRRLFASGFTRSAMPTASQ